MRENYITQEKTYKNTYGFNSGFLCMMLLLSYKKKQNRNNPIK